MLFVTLGISVVFLFLGTQVIIARAGWKFKPRGLKPFKKQVVTDRPSSVSPIMDPFKVRKLPLDIDYIVIGSGIGGLYTAALLARVGRRVVVLEQHYMAGGCMHCFSDGGFDFDTGIHYLGKIPKYGKLIDLVSQPGEQVEWAPLGCEADGYTYDEILLGDLEPFKMRKGQDRLVEDLTARFPAEAAAIEAYVVMCQKVNKSADTWFFSKLFPVWLQALFNRRAGESFRRYASMSAAELITNCGVKDPKLFAILCGQFGDYGALPSQASAFQHAGTAAHYFDGAWYPVGGPNEITKSLVSTIEAAGGRVLVRAPVSEILIETGRAVGVKVGTNEVKLKHPSRGGIISSAGALITLDLLKSSGVESAGKIPWAGAVRGEVSGSERCPHIKQGISHMSCFVGLEGSAEDLGLVRHNQWILPVKEGANPDLEQMCNQYYTEQLEAFKTTANQSPMIFLGFPSAKDPSHAERHPSKSTCVMVCEAKTEWFDQWRGVGRSGHRKSPEYTALKQEYLNMCISTMNRLFPKTKGKVVYSDIGSPLSNEHYLNRAASYGLEPSCARFTCDSMAALRPQVDGVPGLYMVGQDVATMGWAGALSSAMMTSMAILGYGFWDLVICNRNLIKDLRNVPV